MKALLYRFFTAGMEPSNLTVLRTVVMANAFLLISVVAFSLFSLFNFTFFHSRLLGILDASAAIVSTMALIDLHRNHALSRAIIIGAANFFIFFLTFAYTNQNTDFGLVWTIFFPIFVITLMGHRIGLLMTLLFYSLLFSMAYEGIGVWDEGRWNMRAFLRFSIASGVLTYVVYVYEKALHHSNVDLANTRAKEAEYLEKLHHLSITDPLTGIYNRRQINDALNNLTKGGTESSTPFSLILFDIDDFKSINDNHGHNTGDQILVSVTRIARDFIRKSDSIGRWGGEEFLILLYDTDEATAVHRAETLCKDIEKALFQNNINITCSFGVAQWVPGLQSEQLVDRADQALYAAKQSGKNRVHRFQG